VHLPTLKKLLVVSLQLVTPVHSLACHHEESSECESRAPLKEKAVSAALEAVALEYQDMSDVNEDSDDEARRGEAVVHKTMKDKITDMYNLHKRKSTLKAVKQTAQVKKPRKLFDRAVTTIPQIVENMDELAEWIRGNDCLYRRGHIDSQDINKKMILYNEKAKEMMEARPDLGEVTGKYRFC